MMLLKRLNIVKIKLVKKKVNISTTATSDLIKKNRL